MSQAIASARNRRAFNTPSTTQQGQSPPAVVSTRPSSTTSTQPGVFSTNVNAQGLTLPQVIALVDKRLITLETFMKETKEQPGSSLPENVTLENSIPIPDILDEFNNRFEILAQEIDSMKDIVMKLQSYTMDVNKMLVDERVHVFSELGNHSSSVSGEKEKSIIINSDAVLENSGLVESIQTSVDLRELVKEEFSQVLP
jgi:hypothetical protein